MTAVCFIQESKDADLTLYQQLLLCRRVFRKEQWLCVAELSAPAGTEDVPFPQRPGVPDLLKMASEGAFDVLVVTDADLLCCSQPDLEGLLASLLLYNVHTFSARSGHWLEPDGRHWIILPNYNEEVDGYV